MRFIEFGERKSLQRWRAYGSTGSSSLLSSDSDRFVSLGLMVDSDGDHAVNPQTRVCHRNIRENFSES